MGNNNTEVKKDKNMSYVESELYHAMPYPLEKCGIISIQIRSEMGKTKWLNVSPEKMREIEKILERED